jgi:hypothetical protein
MVLESSQPLTDMSPGFFLGGKRRPVCEANNLTAKFEPTVYKMWELQLLTTLRASTVCYRDRFTFSAGNESRCTGVGIPNIGQVMKVGADLLQQLLSSTYNFF